MSIENAIGSVGIIDHKVTAVDLATHWRNDVPVLATPILLWLAELACMRSLEGFVPHGYMTVGSGHECSHLSPTPEGFIVNVSVIVARVNGRSVEFDVSAHDGTDQVLSGKHFRALVQRERFVSRVAEKAGLYSSQGGCHG